MERFNRERVQIQCCAVMVKYDNIFFWVEIQFNATERRAQDFRRETRAVNRLSEFRPNEFQCANMIFVAVCDNESDNVFLAFFQPGCITVLHVAGTDFFFQESHTAINNQVFTLVFIDIHILADVFQTTQRHKIDFIVVFIGFVFVHTRNFCRLFRCRVFACATCCFRGLRCVLGWCHRGFFLSNFYHINNPFVMVIHLLHRHTIHC